MASRKPGPAVRLVVRSEWRRRTPALIGLALLTAVVVAVVVSVSAGARRTATVVDRFLEATDARDYGVLNFGLFGSGGEGGLPAATETAERLESTLAEVTGVEQVGAAIGYPTAASEEFDFTVVSSPSGTMFAEIDRPLAREGRLPRDGAAGEVVVNDAAANLLGVGVGDTIEAPTFSPADCETLLADDRFPGFNGPRLRLRVVGRVMWADDLRGAAAESAPMGIASPAFARRHEGSVCSTVLFTGVRGAAGVSSLQAAVDSVTEGSERSLVDTAASDFEDVARAAADVLTVVLVLAAIAAGLAGAVTVAQAVRRQVMAASTEAVALAAIGFDRHQRALTHALPAGVAVAGGAVAGGAVAVLVSGMFPLSFGRRMEPHPGLAFDPAIVLAGVFLCVIAAAGWAYVVARRSDGPADHTPHRPSPTVELAARRGLPPTATLGLRLAYDRGPATRRVPTRSALAGGVVAVLGLVAVLTFTSTLGHTLASPASYGWNWSSTPGIDADPDELIAALGEEGRVEAVGHLVGGSVDVVGTGRLEALALEDVHGTTRLTLRRGRAPAADDEVAVGARTLEDLDADLGDQIEVEDPAGGERSLTVVGEVVMPLVNDVREPGQGVVVTVPVIRELVQGDVEEDLPLRYRDGVDVEELEADLGELGLSFSGYAYSRPPGRLGNLDAVDGVFAALAVFLALLGAAGLTHALAVSVRSNRGSFAALRALGFRRAQVRDVVVWQSLAVAAAALVLGLVLGLAAGRLAWRLAIADLGIVEVITVPGDMVAGLAAGVLGVAVLLALTPAYLATRTRPAEALRAE